LALAGAGRANCVPKIENKSLFLRRLFRSRPSGIPALPRSGLQPEPIDVTTDSAVGDGVQFSRYFRAVLALRAQSADE
jgi:hypothetical protein